MTWLKLDDQIFLNRKVARCDSGTKLLYIVGLTYCANQLTDGFIPEATLPLLAGMAGLDWQIAKQSAGKLLDVCLWVATDDGWQIPDYLEYNPSREQVTHNREVRSEAGKRGGYAKSKQNAGKLPSKTLANDKQNPGKSLPPSPDREIERDVGIEIDDNEIGVIDADFGTAISHLHKLGVVTGPVLQRFHAIWPDIAGERVAWVSDAVMVAQQNGANSAAYAVTILENSIRENRRPGEARRTSSGNGKSHGKRETFADRDESYEALKRKYIPAGYEDAIVS